MAIRRAAKACGEAPNSEGNEGMNCDPEWTADHRADALALLHEWAAQWAETESWRRTLREIRALPETRR